MADPSFPVGRGIDLVGGGANSRGGYVLKILYVETKEYQILWHPQDPAMACATNQLRTCGPIFIVYTADVA